MRDNEGNDQDTMTLRDRFAMAASSALLEQWDRWDSFEEIHEADIAGAKRCYQIADAMLAARAKAMPVRTAEEERADVVAYLRERADQGPAFATVMLNMAAKELEDGNHVGAAKRAKSGAK